MTTQVYELLLAKGNRVSVQGKDYIIKCLNPEHEDNNPSLRVDQISGVFNCYSCGFKGSIFKYYNIFSSNIPIKIAQLKQKISRIKTMTTGLEFPPGTTEYLRSFRGISSATLRHFEAFHTSQVEALEDRLVFPIRNVLGKIQAFSGRHMLSDANPRYVHYPPHIQLPLFPATLPNNPQTMVLVEGIFDMLNLFDKGLHNSVCTFGTTTLIANTAEKLLTYKVQGVEKIYLMFDGDPAGRKAQNQLKPLIEKCGFRVEIIDLQDGQDPGILSSEEVQSINEYINKHVV